MCLRKMIKIHYPWEKTPVKGGFFVPTLQLEVVRLDGIKAAINCRVKAKAEPCVKDGMLGVWFTRLK